jgi:hypothetical protein
MLSAPPHALLLRRKNMMAEKGFKVLWNQLVQNGDFALGFKGWSLRYGRYSFEDNVLKFDGTGFGTYNSQIINDSIIDLNHRFYCKSLLKSNKVGDVCFGNLNWGEYKVEYTKIDNYSLLKRIIGGDKNLSGGLVVKAGVSERIMYVKYVNYLNLTLMFGIGNEPPTTTDFEEWLMENGYDLNEYIPYDAGTVRYMTRPKWL